MAVTVTKERGFMTQEGLDKFTYELDLISEVNKTLFHNDWQFNFRAIRIQRDMMFKIKKVAELIERRYQRYALRAEERGTPVTFKFKNDI